MAAAAAGRTEDLHARPPAVPGAGDRRPESRSEGQTTVMRYDRTVHLDADFATTVERVRDALAAQGFGILTEIDVTATLKAKLGRAAQDMEDYVILGACNPSLAHRALDTDRSIGLLLPCNVVVRRDGDGTAVQALDPHTMIALTELDALRPVAEEATRRLDTALASLTAAESTG